MQRAGAAYPAARVGAWLSAHSPDSTQPIITSSPLSIDRTVSCARASECSLSFAGPNHRKVADARSKVRRITGPRAEQGSSRRSAQTQCDGVAGARALDCRAPRPHNHAIEGKPRFAKPNFGKFVDSHDRRIAVFQIHVIIERIPSQRSSKLTTIGLQAVYPIVGPQRFATVRSQARRCATARIIYSGRLPSPRFLRGARICHCAHRWSINRAG